MSSQKPKERRLFVDPYLTGHEWLALYDSGFFERYFAARTELFAVLGRSGPFSSWSEVHDSACALLETAGSLSTGGRLVPEEVLLFPASFVLAHDYLKQNRRHS